jgi:hypothetical protein
MSHETDDAKRLNALAVLMAGARAGDADCIRRLEEIKRLPGLDEIIQRMDPAMWAKYGPAGDKIH